MKEENHVSTEWDDDWDTAYDLAKSLNARFNQGDRHLTCIKVLINPEQKTAGIYAGYEDVSRLRETGSEDTMAALCEASVKWPVLDHEESWDDPLYPFKYPKAQMMRGYLLSGHLKTQFLVFSTSNQLKAGIEDGEPKIYKIKE